MLLLRPFDPATMLIMIALASATMACALGFMHNTRREGLGLWALALVLQSGAFTLYALRDVAPAWASVVLANVLLAMTFSLALGAVAQYHGRPLPWLQMAWPVPLVGVLYCLNLDDDHARVLIAGVLQPLQLSLLVWALWRPSAPVHNRGAVLLTLGCGMEAALITTRATLVAFFGVNGSLLHPGTMQSVVYIAAFVVVIFVSLGFVLMTKDRADAQNAYLAWHDSLTGLVNRRAIQSALERDTARALRQGTPYAVLLLDIDHFKAINDCYGHLAGDAMLRHVADTLQQRIRTQDMAGRYGGEELVVLLPDTAMSGALTLAMDLCQHIGQSVCLWQGHALRVTVSVGVCAGTLQAGDNGDRLIALADQAMYQAKQRGRNRVQAIDSTAAPQAQAA